MFDIEIYRGDGVQINLAPALTFVDMIEATTASGSKTYTNLDTEFELLYTVVRTGTFPSNGKTITTGYSGGHPYISWTTSATPCQILVYAR